MQKEIGLYRQSLSREMINQANTLIEDLGQCILNIGDEAVLYALKKAYDAFIKVFSAKDAGTEIIEHYYEDLRLNLVAALRHYDYISVVARAYVSAELEFIKHKNEFSKYEEKYDGSFMGIVPFKEAITYIAKVGYLISTGQVPTTEELEELDNRILLCKNVVEVL